jgi:hypothetical protein
MGVEVVASGAASATTVAVPGSRIRLLRTLVAVVLVVVTALPDAVRAL